MESFMNYENDNIKKPFLTVNRLIASCLLMLIFDLAIDGYLDTKQGLETHFYGYHILHKKE